MGLFGSLKADRQGAVAAEFAMLIPVLVMILFALVRFGVALNQRLELNDGIRAGASQFTIGRSNDTAWSDAVSRFRYATPGLIPASVTLSLNVDGTNCSSDATCRTVLAAAQGQTATLAATYPCDLSILGHDFAPGCTLASARRVD